MRAVAMLLLLAALLAGCGGARPGGGPDTGGPTAPAPVLPARDPFVTGTITKIEGGRVLVESDPDKQEGNKCLFALTAATVVAAERQGQLEKVDQGALKVGQRVKAWEAGAVLESYPCQTGGLAILITES